MRLLPAESGDVVKRNLASRAGCPYNAAQPMKLSLCLPLLAALLPFTATAFSPITPYPKITTSESGLHCVVMMPAQYGEKPSADGTLPVLRPAYGIGYAMRPDGTLQERWRVEGWYSFHIFLSDDGRHLVRLEPFVFAHQHDAEGIAWEECEPKPEDIAVEFYEDGKLLHRYTVVELVKDLGATRANMGGYDWISRHAGEPREYHRHEPFDEPRLSTDGEFRLTTCDGVLYRLSIFTGQILEHRPPATPKPFSGTTPDQLQRLAVEIGLIPDSATLETCRRTLSLENWEKRIAQIAPAGAPASHHILLPITNPDDPRGFFELSLALRNYLPAAEKGQESGEVVGLHLFFRYPDGGVADCIEQLCAANRRELEFARERARYAKMNPSLEQRTGFEKPVPAYDHWFRRYYAQPE